MKNIGDNNELEYYLAICKKQEEYKNKSTDEFLDKKFYSKLIDKTNEVDSNITFLYEKIKLINQNKECQESLDINEINFIVDKTKNIDKTIDSVYIMFINVNDMRTKQYKDKIENLKNKTLLLQHLYFKVITECNAITLDNKLEKVTNDIKKLSDDYQNVGHTVLNMIISFTMVSVGIEAIVKIDKYYIPLFICTIVWLCLTILVFNHSLFNSYDYNSQLAIKIYRFITCITISIFVITLLFIFPNIIPLGEQNDSNSNNNIIIDIDND